LHAKAVCFTVNQIYSIVHTLQTGKYKYSIIFLQIVLKHVSDKRSDENQMIKHTKLSDYVYTKYILNTIPI